MTENNKRIIRNISDVESLREDMKLNIQNFCKLLGLQPGQYYNWRRDGSLPNGPAKILFNLLNDNRELIHELADISIEIERE